MIDKIKKSKNKFLLIASLSSLLFIILSFLVNKDIFHNADYDVLIYFQNILGRNFDLPFSLLTLLGSSEITISATVLVFLFLLWRRRHLFSGIFLILSIYAFEFAGKIFIYHPKPPVIFNRYVLNFFFPSSFIVHTEFSYPSGHMARASFLALVIMFICLQIVKNKLQRIIIPLAAVLFITFMAISRIYLGEHWLSDVLGGLLLGETLAVLAISFW